jgi:hypothetical protein
MMARLCDQSCGSHIEHEGEGGIGAPGLSWGIIDYGQEIPIAEGLIAAVMGTDFRSTAIH